MLSLERIILIKNMNRIDRLMGIITHLQAKKNLTVLQIAEQFSISKRTVFRDLRAIGEIGVPVSFEPEKGYSVGNGYFLPPVSLTVEEANALSLAEPLVFRKGASLPTSVCFDQKIWLGYAPRWRSQGCFICHGIGSI
jgi:predicted DNA-binding transcriptional regulator YafY